jgi:hypothetical protein
MPATSSARILCVRIPRTILVLFVWAFIFEFRIVFWQRCCHLARLSCMGFSFGYNGMNQNPGTTLTVIAVVDQIRVL